MRCWSLTQANVKGTPPFWLAMDIETRPPAANQFEFSEKRGKLVRCAFPNEGFGISYNASGLRVAAFDPKIAEQARSQAFCLADIS
jgi:hypothetical protein